MTSADKRLEEHIVIVKTLTPNETIIRLYGGGINNLKSEGQMVCIGLQVIPSLEGWMHDDLLSALIKEECDKATESLKVRHAAEMSVLDQEIMSLKAKIKELSEEVGEDDKHT